MLEALHAVMLDLFLVELNPFFLYISLLVPRQGLAYVFLDLIPLLYWKNVSYRGKEEICFSLTNEASFNF